MCVLARAPTPAPAFPTFPHLKEARGKIKNEVSFSLFSFFFLFHNKNQQTGEGRGGVSFLILIRFFWGVLCVLGVVRGAQGETRVISSGAPEKMRVIGCIVGVTWIGGDRLQIRLLRRPKVLLRHPQKARIFVVRLRIRRLHRYRSFEVLLRSVNKQRKIKVNNQHHVRSS